MGVSREFDIVLMRVSALMACPFFGFLVREVFIDVWAEPIRI